MATCKKCEIRQATEKHHLFPNTKKNREIYGKELLDHKNNIQLLCYSCHHGHNGKVDHYSEKHFCEIMGIIPRGKTETFKRLVNG